MENKNLADLKTGLSPEKGRVLADIVGSYSSAVSLVNDFSETFHTTDDANEDDEDIERSLRLVALYLDRGVGFKKENPYHSKQHFLEVYASAEYLAHFDNLLNSREKKIVALSALCHDLEHNGIGNAGQNFRLEEKSFEYADKIFVKCEVPEKDRKTLREIILATDVNGPSLSMREAYKTFNRDRYNNPSRLEFIEEMPSVLGDKHVNRMAAILCDADLLFSAGIDYKSFVAHDTAIADEMKGKRSLKGCLYFLDVIAQGEFVSPTARVFNKNLSLIKNQAMKEFTHEVENTSALVHESKRTLGR